MIKYVAGFMISEDRSKVLLVLKNRPIWQAGKLNAIGGKIEADEFPRDAMVREFREETGIDTDSWDCFAVVNGLGYQVYFYVSEGDLSSAKTITDESILAVNVDEIHNLHTVHNIKWLLPMAINRLSRNDKYHYTIEESRV